MEFQVPQVLPHRWEICQDGQPPSTADLIGAIEVIEVLLKGTAAKPVLVIRPLGGPEERLNYFETRLEQVPEEAACG